jgi:hypothetical protein
MYEMRELSAGCYSLMLKSKEEGSSELRRSSMLECDNQLTNCG